MNKLCASALKFKTLPTVRLPCVFASTATTTKPPVVPVSLSSSDSSSSSSSDSESEKAPVAIDDDLLLSTQLSAEQEASKKSGELLSHATRILEQYHKLMMFSTIHGRKVSVPENLTLNEIQKQFDKEIKYLLPTQLKVTSKNIDVRRKKLSDVPLDSPAHDANHRPKSPAHFTSFAPYYDLLEEFEKLKDNLDAALLSGATNTTTTTSSSSSSSSSNNDAISGIAKSSSDLIWLKKPEFELRLGLPLLVSQYRTLITELNQLWQHPLSHNIRETHLAAFLRASAAKTVNQPKQKTLNERGQAEGLGKRKTSSALVWVTPGTGKFTVNDVNLTDYFQKLSDKFTVFQPLALFAIEEKYDVKCVVRGGGHSGQAGAIRLGLSRALIIVQPELRPTLKKAGFLTRDTRVVERKKPGQAGARRKFQWVKR